MKITNIKNESRHQQRSYGLLGIIKELEKKIKEFKEKDNQRIRRKRYKPMSLKNIDVISTKYQQIELNNV